MEDSPLGLPEETRCDDGDQDSGCSGHRAAVSVGEVVCGGVRVACGSREECEL